MKSTGIFNNKVFNNGAAIFLGALLSLGSTAVAQENKNIKEPSVSKPIQFSGQDKKYEGFALPEIDCDTKKALNGLQLFARSNPLPTHDGVSPWPGLWGFWVHQKAGAYAVITGFKTEDAKQSGIKVKLINLCTNKVLAEGKTEVNALNLPMTSFSVSLENKTLKKIRDPKIIISRVTEPKKKESLKENPEPSKNLVGLTLKYKVGDAEDDSELEEAILLKNLLNTDL